MKPMESIIQRAKANRSPASLRYPQGQRHSTGTDQLSGRLAARLRVAALLLLTLVAAEGGDPFLLHADTWVIDQTNASLVDAVDAVEFVPAKDILVTELGYYDHGGDGLLHLHPVGIYESATETLLVSVTIGSEDRLDPETNNRFEALPEQVLLKAGSAYSVAGWSNLGPVYDPYRVATDPQQVTIDPMIAHQEYRHTSSNSGLRYPTNTGQAGYPHLICWFGETFRFALPFEPDYRITGIEFSKASSDLTITCESQRGLLYHLRSATDLGAEREAWPIHGSYHAITATPPHNVLTIQRPADSHRYFAIEASPSFKSIPAGSFLMGDQSPEPKDGFTQELPVHRVEVGAFLIQATEVTKAQWDANQLAAIENGYNFDKRGAGKGPDHPVHSVNWFDVVKWCNALSEQDGLEPCYYSGEDIYRTGQDPEVTCDFTKDGYRLPTEAEWEKAARGGLLGERFPWGELIDHSNANYNSVRPGGAPIRDYDISPTSGWHPDYARPLPPFTAPAGSFAPNGYGLHEMPGNVWEWCWDWYSENYYSSSPESNPHGPSSGDEASKVARGGSWAGVPVSCRNSHRAFSDPKQADQTTGFRLARTEKR